MWFKKAYARFAGRFEGRFAPRILGDPWFLLVETNDLRDGQEPLPCPKLYDNSRLQRLLGRIGVTRLGLPLHLGDDDWWKDEDEEEDEDDEDEDASVSHRFAGWSAERFMVFCCVWQALYGDASALLDLAPDGQHEGTGTPFVGDRAVRIDATVPVLRVNLLPGEWWKAGDDELVPWITAATPEDLRMILAHELAPERDALAGYFGCTRFPV